MLKYKELKLELLRKTLSILLVFALCATMMASCVAGRPNPKTDEAEETIESAEDRKKNFPADEDLEYYNEVYSLLHNNDENFIFSPYYFFDEEKSTPRWDEYDNVCRFLHVTNKLISYVDKSVAYPFLKITSEMTVNPFSNFNLLLKSGLVKERITEDERNDTSGNVVFDFTKSEYDGCGMYMQYNIPSKPVEKKVYSFTEKGCRELIETANAFEKTNVHTITFLDFPFVSDPVVDFSKEDNCYYIHNIYYNGSVGHITGIYFRSSDGKRIDDVTLQLMMVHYPATDAAAGVSLSYPAYRSGEKLGAMSLMMAIEKALTGEVLLDNGGEIFSEVKDERMRDKKYVMPSTYEGKGYKVNVSEKRYESKTEQENDIRDYYLNYTYNVKLK
ncbi:MAG: hypothetical protein IKD18_00215 [Clostridia bacterium]|nr:hypothetical protein [Clostridia bacterium]